MIYPLIRVQEIVGDTSVVNEHKDFKTINLRYIQHTRLPFVDS